MANEFDFVTPEHFVKAPDRAAALRLFKQSVIMVEIEVFSYCNRRCWFCPNSQIDRISENIHMPAGLYQGILAQLAEIGFDRTISYSRYNEPLADRIILQRIREARAALPAATLHTNTNGDYLNTGYLRELHDAGLNSINIQVYLQNEEHYDHERMRKKAEFIIKKLGVPATLTNDTPNEWIEYRLTFENMAIRLYGRNFDANGCSRGDTLPIRDEYIRKAPCISPFSFVYIDYNGKMLPCCNLRSDVPDHGKYIVHDLAVSNDIFAAYAQSALVKWRQSLVGWQEKQGVCKSCAFPYTLHEATAEDLQVHERLVAEARTAKESVKA